MSSASTQLAASSRCFLDGDAGRFPRWACSARVMFSCTLSSLMMPSVRLFSEE